jgi:hypothetical protein
VRDNRQGWKVWTKVLSVRLHTVYSMINRLLWGAVPLTSHLLARETADSSDPSPWQKQQGA